MDFNNNSAYRSRSSGESEEIEIEVIAETAILFGGEHRNSCGVVAKRFSIFAFSQSLECSNPQSSIATGDKPTLNSVSRAAPVWRAAGLAMSAYMSDATLPIVSFIA